MVGTSYPPEGRGGTDVHMAQLARALKGCGHDVAVHCRTAREELPDHQVLREEVEGVPVSRVNYLFRDVKRYGDLLSNPGHDRVLVQRLEEDPPDLVHVHHLTCLSTSMLDRVRERGIPLVMTLHDFWMVCPRGQRITPELHLCHDLDRERCAPCLQRLWPHLDITPELLRSMDREMLGRLQGCDLLLTPSAFHRERYLELELDPSRVRVVPHGLDHELFAARRASPWPVRRVGYIGSVIPSKGVHVLVEAMNLLGRADMECHVFGEAPDFHGDGGYLQRLRGLARPDLPFHFHGAYGQDELPGILGGLQAVVVPSLWWEAYCLTIREAMLAGVPVLASDLGAMHEALADLGEDVLFTPGDARDLMHKLHALAEDPERCRRLSRLRGRVRTLDEMAVDTEALYREVAGHPERRRAEREHLLARKRRGASRPYATVFIPTWNGGPLFERVLDRVLSQETDFDYEVLCIDSGSTDGTVDVIRSRSGVRLMQIPNESFNHGLTRNLGVREARGEVVALLTQDALPRDQHWLRTLVENFDDPEVAGAYCHQIPREDCNPFQKDRLRGWTAGEGRPRRKRLAEPSAWERLDPFDRYRLVAFDDVASCVRRSVMEEIPYAKRQFGEDVEWARRAVLAGHTLVMDPRAVVIHSHDNSILYEFKRVYLDHQNLHELVGLHTVPTLRHVAAFSAHLTWKLLRAVWRDRRSVAGRIWWSLKTPFYAFTQNLAQYLGARSVEKLRRGRWRRVDRFMRKAV